MSSSISRRSAVGFMGAGVLAGLIANGAEAPATDGVAAQEALGSVRVGSKFARWTIKAIQPAEAGALTLTLAGEDGQEFRLEVMARDASIALRPPAETEHLAIYVRNGGDGWLPTVEDQGLAAMTLAEVITANGLSGRIEGLLTHSQRIAMHHTAVMTGPAEV